MQELQRFIINQREPWYHELDPQSGELTTKLEAPYTYGTLDGLAFMTMLHS